MITTGKRYFVRTNGGETSTVKVVETRLDRQNGEYQLVWVGVINEDGIERQYEAKRFKRMIIARVKESKLACA